MTVIPAYYFIDFKREHASAPERIGLEVDHDIDTV